MKIMFGICTYNRAELLGRTATSLNQIKNIDKADIYIFDDCSTEYDTTYLQSLFPTAKNILTSNVNRGADFNTNRMYKFFLSTDCDLLFNADSDLLFDPEILNIIETLTSKSDGFFSLFNTVNHDTVEFIDEDFILKKSVGAAGTCLTRNVVEKIVSFLINCEKHFDWKYCKILQQNGIRILCTKRSYVQHIGFVGFNSNPLNIDYGSNFKINSEVNAQILEDTIEDYFEHISDNKQTVIKKIAIQYNKDNSIYTKCKNFMYRNLKSFYKKIFGKN